MDKLKAAFLGAGYISKYHANAQDIFDLVAVADFNKARASKLSANACKNLDELFNYHPQVIHILTPPDYHAQEAIKALDKGANVFLEKPMCLNTQEASAIIEKAKQKNLRVGVNHNFLFYPVYEELKNAIQSKELGPIDHVTITWHRDLDLLKTGPYDNWMLKDPKNLILEIGSHLAALYLDLIGKPDRFNVEASDPIDLPSGITVYRRLIVIGYKNQICGEIRLSLRSGMDERSIEVRGLNGKAKVDFDANTFILKKNGSYSLDFDRYFSTRKEASQLNVQGFNTLKNYILSKFKLSKIKDPYSQSIDNSIRTFYTKDDPRQSAEFGKEVIAFCEAITEKLPKIDKKTPTSYIKTTTPKILVLGGSGFIGKAFLNKLKEPVKVLSRNQFSHPNVELIRGSLSNDDDIKRALEGVDTVVHLARAQASTWDEYQKQEIDVNYKLAKIAESFPLKRFIYTGTIDSYYAGEPNQKIDDTTPLDPHLASRNFYARAKGLSEEAFKNLPYIILRPAIVIGEGTSPFHFGVGRFSANGTVCELWGEGNNYLPLVWVNDVADAIRLAIDTPNIEKETFLLTSPPLLTARAYIEALSKALNTKIEILPTSPLSYYSIDLFKWLIKTLVNHPNRKLPSYQDWNSRTQKALFDSSRAERILNWHPIKDKNLLIKEGIEKPAHDWLK